MPNRVRFEGQNIQLWFRKPEDRQRLDKVLEQKYNGQFSRAGYLRLALERQLERDEADMMTKKAQQPQQHEESAIVR